MAITDWSAASQPGRQQRVIAAACAAGVTAVVALEFVAPRQVTLGTLSLLPVVVACLAVRAGWAGWIIGLAVAGRVVAAVVWDIDEALAAVESAAILGVGLAALWLGHGRAAGSSGVERVQALTVVTPEVTIGPEVPVSPLAEASGPVAEAVVPVAKAPAPVPEAAVRVPEAVAPAWHAVAGSLTRREREVVDLAAHGLTARRIAIRLSISDRTVETHLARAYQKLGISSKQELVALTIETGSDRPSPGR